MDQIDDGLLLWEPSDEDISNARITHYLHWLNESRNLIFTKYEKLWQWSVSDLGAFWKSLWDYFEVTASSQPESILIDEHMPGAKWFDGARLNYAENFFSRAWDDRPAVLYFDEAGQTGEIDWTEIQEKSKRLAIGLKEMGVEPGDRVVAYMPHIPETVIALFATASIGAVWSSCSPDFGSRSVLDRFQQIEPKILLAVDGYQYNGRIFDRRQVIDDLQKGLPTLTALILLPFFSETAGSSQEHKCVTWEQLISADPGPKRWEFEQVPFDHPLWVLYSSGTTGLPKPIVQGHGGILLEHLKMAVLHLDLKPGDHFFWYTSTGWMMWNFLIGGLLSGATIVIYNGSPGYPDLNYLWKLAAKSSVTYFGTSAAFINACMKAGLSPSRNYNLKSIKAVGSTGSPLTAEGFSWVYQNVNSRLSLESVSGGTDLCTAFVGGCKLMPIYAGEIQTAALGASVHSFDKHGHSIINEVGELVLTKPMPSMPIYFWNDPENIRYLESYFDYYPGIWRHGDWIKLTDRGSWIIYGRSDSTINRQGIRMGTSELYRAVESLPEVIDSLVVDLEILGRESFMPLFVVMLEGELLSDELKNRIRKSIQRDVSPRHVPDEILEITEVPYTLSGKKMEIPVRRILLGQPAEEVANPGAMRNPGSVDFFVKYSLGLKKYNNSSSL